MDHGARDLVQRFANTLAFERRCIRSSFVAQVRRTLPVRLHSRASLARRIDALDASGYLRDATLGSPAEVNLSSRSADTMEQGRQENDTRWIEQPVPAETGFGDRPSETGH